MSNRGEVVMEGRGDGKRQGEGKGGEGEREAYL